MKSGQGAESVSDEMNVTRGTSEEDDAMTPAQSRRKAQNRAAYVHSLSLCGPLTGIYIYPITALVVESVDVCRPPPCLSQADPSTS